MRRLDGSTGGGTAAGSAGYHPPGVSYSAPTYGAKTEAAPAGQWQAGEGSIQGDHAAALGGAGVGGQAPAAAAPSSGAGGNAITPNN